MAPAADGAAPPHPFDCVSPMALSSVLFVCVANRARSQMAEALARAAWGPRVRVQSAGSAPGGVHPLALRVLDEVGVPTAGLSSKHIDTIDPDSVDLVITLCAEAACPVALVTAPRLRWDLPDPDRRDEDRSPAQQLADFRATRDAIAAHIAAMSSGGFTAEA